MRALRPGATFETERLLAPDEALRIYLAAVAVRPRGSERVRLDAAFGRVLVSSKQYPDLIMDAFAFRRDFVQKYPGTVKDFVKAYYDAYTWMTQNQDQANQLIGAAVKESASDVQGDLGTMTIYSLAQSKVIMGTNDHPGKIFSNAKAAGDFWKQQGQVSSTVDPKQAVDASFLASM